jgi:hypothetical protein
VASVAFLALIYLSCVAFAAAAPESPLLARLARGEKLRRWLPAALRSGALGLGVLAFFTWHVKEAGPAAYFMVLSGSMAMHSLVALAVPVVPRAVTASAALCVPVLAVCALSGAGH